MRPYPTRDNVLISTEQGGETVSGSGIIVQTGDKKPEVGTVLAVGPDCANLKEGDRVVFKVYAPEDIEIDGQKYQVIRNEDVIAIMRE